MLTIDSIKKMKPRQAFHYLSNNYSKNQLSRLMQWVKQLYTLDIKKGQLRGGFLQFLIPIIASAIAAAGGLGAAAIASRK